LRSVKYAGPRKFRQKLEGWLDLIRVMWPECPAVFDEDGMGLILDRVSTAITQEVAYARR
jgi:hypothetical protein